jgi:hypothetical protein
MIGLTHAWNPARSCAGWGLGDPMFPAHQFLRCQGCGALVFGSPRESPRSPAAPPGPSTCQPFLWTQDPTAPIIVLTALRTFSSPALGVLSFLATDSLLVIRPSGEWHTHGLRCPYVAVISPPVRPAFFIPYRVPKRMLGSTCAPRFLLCTALGRTGYSAFGSAGRQHVCRDAA